jgi:hypothetical protein
MQDEFDFRDMIIYADEDMTLEEVFAIAEREYEEHGS